MLQYNHVHAPKKGLFLKALLAVAPARARSASFWPRTPASGARPWDTSEGTHSVKLVHLCTGCPAMAGRLRRPLLETSTHSRSEAASPLHEHARATSS
jgi:hypothetical protein